MDVPISIIASSGAVSLTKNIENVNDTPLTLQHHPMYIALQQFLPHVAILCTWHAWCSGNVQLYFELLLFMQSNTSEIKLNSRLQVIISYMCCPALNFPWHF
jgi:hypothetical protein